MALSLEQRFWAKVNKNGPTQPHMDTPCWEWTGAKSGGRYGVIWYEGRNVLAHRMSHQLATGERPEMVCHHCDNKVCVNPAHLYSGNADTNGADAAARAPLLTGESNHKSKLTERDIKEIRLRYEQGETQTTLGKDYGVSHVAVGQIVQRKTWRHVA